jgi:N-acetylneuraminate synthase
MVWQMIIGNRKIGRNEPPLIIAEIGINHGGDINVAKKMVKLASESGAECIKHQTHFVEDEMTEEAKSIFPPNADISIWEVMESCALSKIDEIELKNYTESLGLIYLSTPFSRKAADFLSSIDVPAFKIGSGEADNLPLIKHIVDLGKPIIMSTGMQSITSLKKSVEILSSSNIDFALLECTNLYPSSPENVSLGGILELQHAFPGVDIGFSDHSIGPDMALAAVALGACIIERHFTDSRYRIGPDISCSMDPAELRKLVCRSKEIHTSLHNIKKRTDLENSVYRFARGSVVADRNLIAGEVITPEDIWVRRPGTGEIPPDMMEKLYGKTVKRNLKLNSQLKWEDFN